MAERKFSSFKEKQQFYQSQMEAHEKYLIRKKKVRRRRLLFMLSIYAILLTPVYSFYKEQKLTITEKDTNRVSLKKELSELVQEEVYLREEIEKLNDDDYIADLARRDYFLSQKGEIIFSVPKHSK